MDDRRVGAALRALRWRNHLRQVDVAGRADVAQVTVSRLERGHLDSLSLRTIRPVCAVVDARFDGERVWRGGALDRLLDQRHAMVVSAVSETMQASGWGVQPEVTFSVFGERGSIDLLGVSEGPRVVLVVEVKTELPSLEGMLRRLDAKVRLAPGLCRERLGWRPARTGGFSSCPRPVGIAARSGVTGLCSSLPFHSAVTRWREWLRTPSGPMSGLWLLSLSHPGDSWATSCRR